MPIRKPSLKLDLDSSMVERHLDAINARLATATAEQAYALGLLTAFVLRHGVLIPDVILDATSAVKSIREACELAATVWELRDREE